MLGWTKLFSLKVKPVLFEVPPQFNTLQQIKPLREKGVMPHK